MPQNKLSELMKEYGDRPLNEIMDELMKQPPIEKSGQDDTRLSDMMKYYNSPSHVEAAGKEGEWTALKWWFNLPDNVKETFRKEQGWNYPARNEDIDKLFEELKPMPPSRSPGKAEEEKYRAETCSAPLGETGDYDSWIELICPNFNLQCFDPKVELEEVQDMADKLNSAQRSIKWPTALQLQEWARRTDIPLSDAEYIITRMKELNPSPSCGKE